MLYKRDNSLSTGYFSWKGRQPWSFQTLFRLFSGGSIIRDLNTTNLRPTSEIVILEITDYQSEQLDHDRSGNRTCNLEHSSTLTIPLYHPFPNLIRGWIQILCDECLIMELINCKKEKLQRSLSNLYEHTNLWTALMYCDFSFSIGL